MTNNRQTPHNNNKIDVRKFTLFVVDEIITINIGVLFSTPLRRRLKITPNVSFDWKKIIKKNEFA